VPFLFADPKDYDAVALGDKLVIGNLRKIIAGDGTASVKNETQQRTFKVVVALTDRQKRLLLAGGLLAAVARGEA